MSMHRKQQQVLCTHQTLCMQAGRTCQLGGNPHRQLHARGSSIAGPVLLLFFLVILLVQCRIQTSRQRTRLRSTLESGGCPHSSCDRGSTLEARRVRRSASPCLQLLKKPCPLPCCEQPAGQ